MINKIGLSFIIIDLAIKIRITVYSPSAETENFERELKSDSDQPFTSTDLRHQSNNLRGWLSDEEKHRKFITFWKERKLTSTKYVDLNWFHVYAFQSTSSLPSRYSVSTGNARVLYFNLKARDRVYFTRVKGLDIILDDDIWTTVAQLQLDEDAVMLTQGLEGFNKILDFRSFLKNPEVQVNRKQLLVGSLKSNERPIHYLIMWLLCPRASNHAQCSKVNLMVIYGIVNKIKIHWPSLICDTMMKAKRQFCATSDEIHLARQYLRPLKMTTMRWMTLRMKQAIYTSIKKSLLFLKEFGLCNPCVVALKTWCWHRARTFTRSFVILYEDPKEVFILCEDSKEVVIIRETLGGGAHPLWVSGETHRAQPNTSPSSQLCGGDGQLGFHMEKKASKHMVEKHTNEASSGDQCRRQQRLMEP
ncbi:hypothetical protein V8G54_032673 [Vigna mungo]|uniref:Uncharacterized protein n=1 Tax=Vigna mungo TaxID=3915 RepID=A0AAQ3MMI4_VIGMU